MGSPRWPLLMSEARATPRRTKLVVLTMLRLCPLLLALALGAAHASSDDGSSSANACRGACTGTGPSRKCTFTAVLDFYSTETGAFTFAECGSTVSPA